MTFRDEHPRCPACGGDHALTPLPEATTRLGCARCRGVLVPTTEVEDMLSSLQGEPFVLATGVGGERTCPCCTTKLATLDLFGIEVDRCAAHGVWFDGKELTSVLEAASGVDPKLIANAPARSEGVLGFFRSLLGSRHRAPWMPRRPPED